jgi:molecular chaperone DnaJ
MHLFLYQLPFAARTPQVDYYKALGVPPSATSGAIKRAFRERAKQTHPDASRTNTTVSEFLVIKEAYMTLSSETRRKEYDTKRRVSQAPGQ